MKSSRLAFLALIAGLVASAQAEPIRVGVPATAAVKSPQSGLTRAEVTADYHVWRLSGLEELHRRGRGVPDTNTKDYIQARAKYDEMRASSAFPALVAEVSRRPFAQVRMP